MTDNKATLRKYVEANRFSGEAGLKAAAHQFFAEDAQINTDRSSIKINHFIASNQMSL